MLNYQETLDRAFQSLADPTRRGLIERLAQGPLAVTELARPLPMSLPAVLQHLQVLEAGGLVRSEKTGRVRTYRIETTALAQAEAWIAGRRQMWSRALDRLGQFLAEEADETKDKDTGERQT